MRTVACDLESIRVAGHIRRLRLSAIPLGPDSPNSSIHLEIGWWRANSVVYRATTSDACLHAQEVFSELRELTHHDYRSQGCCHGHDRSAQVCNDSS